MFGPSMRRLLVGAVAAPLLATAVPVAATTAVASSRTTVAGTAVLDTTDRCPDPPSAYADFTDYPPIVMSGDLKGCWYTHIDHAVDLGRPSGLYFEIGREVFVGTIKDKSGSFSTVYSFESKWDPDVTTGKEVWGQCQHPIVPGSGTDALKRITGYLRFVDIVTDTPVSYQYSGFANLT